MLLTNIKRAVISELKAHAENTNGDGCTHLNRLYTFKTIDNKLKINGYDPEIFSLDKLIALAKSLS